MAENVALALQSHQTSVEKGFAASFGSRYLEPPGCTAGREGERTNLGVLVKNAVAVAAAAAV